MRRWVGREEGKEGGKHIGKTGSTRNHPGRVTLVSHFTPVLSDFLKNGHNHAYCTRLK